MSDFRGDYSPYGVYSVGWWVKTSKMVERKYRMWARRRNVMEEIEPKTWRQNKDEERRIHEQAKAEAERFVQEEMQKRLAKDKPPGGRVPTAVGCSEGAEAGEGIQVPPASEVEVRLCPPCVDGCCGDRGGDLPQGAAHESDGIYEGCREIQRSNHAGLACDQSAGPNAIPPVCDHN